MVDSPLISASKATLNSPTSGIRAFGLQRLFELMLKRGGSTNQDSNTVIQEIMPKIEAMTTDNMHI